MELTWDERHIDDVGDARTRSKDRSTYYFQKPGSL